jgi:hypothetical protein
MPTKGVRVVVRGGVNVFSSVYNLLEHSNRGFLLPVFHPANTLSTSFAKIKKISNLISGGKRDDYFVKIFWLSAGEIKAR